MTNHLWESTLFAAVVAALTLVLRKNPARVRHWLWLSASIKFLIPFSLLVSAGSRVQWRTEAPVRLSHVVRMVGQHFSAPDVQVAASTASSIPWTTIGGAVWLAGCAVVLLVWCRRWWRVRSVVREASPIWRRAGIEARSSRGLLEPGVFGIWRPVLLLPEGIAERLTAEQLDAIVTHEMCHVRRRDNLAAAVHTVVEALFWFHPLVWWIGARMVEERERACDEEVLRLGKEPEVYAEGILKVCRYYLESPVECMAGVTGSDLKGRIEQIMTSGIARDLDFGRKLLLAIAGFSAIAGPVAMGVVNAPPMQAQSGTAPAPKYEVAAIRPAKQDEERGFDTEKGHFLAHNVTMKALVARAYDLDLGLISGGPKWGDSDRYDITAKFADEFAQPTSEQGRLMLQSLLADRFQLAVHREPGEVPGYALVVAKNGPKMERANPDLKGIKIRSSRDNHLAAENVTMEAFAKDLRRIVGRVVVDRTGLSGYFKFDLDWMPEVSASNPKPSSDDRPSIFTALPERLGLRLESAKIPVSAIVIDRAERPTEN